jgi:hypothetical protein
LAEAGIEPSVGSVGDSYDNALAETINGLYKAEVIHRRGPWRSFEAVEFATLTWVDWFNNRRLLEPIGNIPPAEAEERYYAMPEEPAVAAQLKPNGLRQTRGGSVQTDSGYTIPMGARGVVYVETPRQASLFNLRGAAGRGVILIRDAENEGCLLIAVRLVASDFGGDSIQTKTAAPIRLALRSERVVEVLARGDDVVSDMFQVTAEQDDPQADILILSGLTGTEGFVLNPGGSIVADIFGVRSERTPCKAVAGAS